MVAVCLPTVPDLPCNIVCSSETETSQVQPDVPGSWLTYELQCYPWLLLEGIPLLQFNVIWG